MNQDKPSVPRQWYSYIGKKGRANQFKSPDEEREHMQKMNKSRWKPRVKVAKEKALERKAAKYHPGLEE